MSRRTRVLAAAVMAPTAIAAVLWLPSPLLAAFVAALMMVALWEWTPLAGLQQTSARMAYLAANAGLMAALAWSTGRGTYPTNYFLLKLVSLIGVGWWLVALAWLRVFEFGRAGGAPIRAIKLLAGTLCVVPAWSALGWLHSSPDRGPAWALFALGVVWAADSGAYFVGVRFGRRKLAPRISPGKSWEGFWGGMGSCLVLAAVAWPALGIAPHDWPLLALVTLLAALASVLGDLFESLLKRHAGIKDSSDLIPGHGGVLDRLDSVLAALPVFVIAKLWLGL